MDSTLALPSPLLNWPRWRKSLLYIAIWTVPALAALSYYHLNRIVTAQPVAWVYALVSTLPWWYLWAILTPGVIWLANRYPINRDTWKVVVPGIYIPAMLVVLGIQAAVNLLVFRGAGIHEVLNFELLQVHFTSRMHVNAVTFWAVLGLYSAFDNYRKYQIQAQQANQLELQLAQANLRALKMQLNPHFLFNTLHSVAALVRKNENATAIKMLGRLGDFLRLALENQGIQQIPLREELDFLERYLEIEKIRFQERLVVEMDVDQNLLECMVPNLILQPLVENAIHHGIAPHSNAGRITLKAFQEDDHLVILIQDDGPGLQNKSSARRGVGLSNTAERLERLYGDQQHLALTNADEGGLIVRIDMPISNLVS